MESLVPSREDDVIHVDLWSVISGESCHYDVQVGMYVEVREQRPGSSLRQDYFFSRRMVYVSGGAVAVRVCSGLINRFMVCRFEVPCTATALSASSFADGRFALAIFAGCLFFATAGGAGILFTLAPFQVYAEDICDESSGQRSISAAGCVWTVNLCAFAGVGLCSFRLCYNALHPGKDCYLTLVFGDIFPGR